MGGRRIHRTQMRPCHAPGMGLAAIPSPGANGLQLGPFDVHVYGLLYAVAVVAAVALTTRLWERRGGSRELVHEVALWGFPAGLVGGRLYFLATSWSEVPAHWWGPFAVWKGGLSIWGGIALGTLAGLWRLRRARADVAAFMDVAAPGLLIAQAIGRIGNYFNQELFGGPTSLPWALQIDPAHRPAAAGCARPASSPSTSPATRAFASSRRRFASTRRTTFSGCG